MSQAYTKLVSGMLFPIQEAFKGHGTVGVRRWLERTQWWDPERIAALQVERLRALLAAAADRVPYYGKMFASLGLEPGDIRTTRDLAALPFLTKADIRANQEALKSNATKDLARFNTGGSSGEPLIFFIGKERVTHDVAAKWRATRWWGVDIGDPEIVVWGSPIELGAQDRMRNLRDRMMRTRLLPAFDMSTRNVDHFIETIRSMRPRMLFGYPSCIAHIAQRAEEQGVRLNEQGVRVAFVTAERLYDDQKEKIERVFGCRVANGYGGRDAGFVAHECPDGGMHITAEDIIVEIVDPKGNVLGPGEAGEVVVTHLATSEYPFIRYRTGDVAVLEERPCSCGRGLPVLREVQGRTTDLLVARDGTVMHGLALIYVLRDVPGVETFQIVQESLERTRVLLVTGRQFRERSVGRIREGIQQRLGSNVEVELERVPRIPVERSGKYRYVVSHVSPYQSHAV